MLLGLRILATFEMIEHSSFTECFNQVEIFHSGSFMQVSAFLAHLNGRVSCTSFGSL